MTEAAQVFAYVYLIGPLVSLVALPLLMHRLGFSRLSAVSPVLAVLALMGGFEALNVLYLGLPLLAWGAIPPFTAASALVVPVTLIVLAGTRRLGGAAHA